MKRKITESVGSYMGTRSKKPKLLQPFEPKKKEYLWISGTDVRNYMIRDPIVDYFKKNRNNKFGKSFDNILFKKGYEFEKNIINYLKKSIDIHYISDKITDESCKETIEAMKKGYPIIHSAPFKHPQKKIKGVIDLLVRSDYLHIFNGHNLLSEHLIKYKAPKLSGNYHYLVIDIKFSTLMLRADGKHLLNCDSYPAYKAQLWIYTEGISYIQGYKSRYAFILGRRYRYTRMKQTYKSLNCLDKLGVVDFGGVDAEYNEKTIKAMNWLKDLNKNGKRWKLVPPSRPELYPNMSVDSGVWNNEKKKIAEESGEITQIWNCGVKNREKAFEKGIYSWRDQKCNSSTLGINGKRACVVDKILDINRQDVDLIRPEKIKNNLYNWKKTENEIFVDFETFADIFSRDEYLPLQEKTDNLFLIGVYYRGEYTPFVVKDTSSEEENRIINDFNIFMEKISNPRIWYWHADKNIWNRVCPNVDYEWCDMLSVFKDEPIVIKGCYKFGLKEIAKCMKNHGFIECELSSDCKSGLEASITAWDIFNNGDKEKINQIINYNKFDVEVLHEILEYLRRQHI